VCADAWVDLESPHRRVKSRRLRSRGARDAPSASLVDSAKMFSLASSATPAIVAAPKRARQAKRASAAVCAASKNAGEHTVGASRREAMSLVAVRITDSMCTNGSDRSRDRDRARLRGGIRIARLAREDDACGHRDARDTMDIFPSHRSMTVSRRRVPSSRSSIAMAHPDPPSSSLRGRWRRLGKRMDCERRDDDDDRRLTYTTDIFSTQRTGRRHARGRQAVLRRVR